MVLRHKIFGALSAVGILALLLVLGTHQASAQVVDPDLQSGVPSSEGYMLDVQSPGGFEFTDENQNQDLGAGADQIIVGESASGSYNLQAGTVYLTAPEPPTALTLTTRTTNSLTWRFTDASIDEEGFGMVSPGGIVVTLSSLARSGTTTRINATETGLIPNTSYTRAPYAYNYIGESIVLPSAYVTKNTLAAVPNTPVITTQYGSTLRHIITVDDGANPDTTEIALYVNGYYLTPEGQEQTQPFWTTARTFVHASLPGNVTFSYRVRARSIDNVLTSLSATASQRTPASGGVRECTSDAGCQINGKPYCDATGDLQSSICRSYQCIAVVGTDADKDGYDYSTVNGSLVKSCDCNDQSGSVNPGVSEVCNGLDDNCDGFIDNAVQCNPTQCATTNDCQATAPYCNTSGKLVRSLCVSNLCSVQTGVDADADGYDDFAGAGCDCNASDPKVSPAGVEICNNIDDNCNGQIDEGLNCASSNINANSSNANVVGAVNANINDSNTNTSTLPEILNPIVTPIVEVVVIVQDIIDVVKDVVGEILAPVVDVLTPVFEIVKTVVAPIVQVIERALAPVIKALQPIIEPIRQVIQNPQVQQVREDVIAPVSTIATVATAAGVAATVPAAANSIWMMIRLVYQVLSSPVAYFSKKKKSWGVVFNSVTKLPIDLAVVRIFDEQRHKLLDTRITDRAGRFQFFVDNGVYYMQAQKEGMIFPSTRMHVGDSNPFGPLYFGGNFSYVKKKDGEVVRYNIPLDPEVVKLSDAMRQDGKIIFRHILKQIQTAVVIASVTLGAINYILLPTSSTLILLIGQIFLLYIFYRLGKERGGRPWGIVYNGENGGNVPLSIVRLATDSGDLVETRVTDGRGRFGFLTGKGAYALTVSKEGFIFPAKRVAAPKRGTNYRGGQFGVDKDGEGLVNFNVPIEPRQDVPKPPAIGGQSPISGGAGETGEYTSFLDVPPADAATQEMTSEPEQRLSLESGESTASLPEVERPAAALPPMTGMSVAPIDSQAAAHPVVEPPASTSPVAQSMERGTSQVNSADVLPGTANGTEEVKKS